MIEKVRIRLQEKVDFRIYPYLSINTPDTMNTTTTKINFNKAGYYFIGFALIVLLGFWNRYFSQLITGTSDNAIYFHFHGIMALLWIAILVVQPILIRKRKFRAHRFIGKLSFIVMPLLIISLLMITQYIGNLTNSEPTFIDVMIGGNVGGGIGIILIFYIIAIWKRHDVNVHARAMIATGIPFIDPALARLLLGFFPNIPPTFIPLITFSVISILLTTLIIVERKTKRARWVFPLSLCINIVFTALLFTGSKIPVVDPAFGKWFRQLPLTTAPEITVKDLPVPKDEIDQYIGEWNLEYLPVRAITYKKEDQLWMRLEEVSNKKMDSTKLLYQGDNKFIIDKDELFFRRGPGKHLSSLNFFVQDGKARYFTPYFGGTVNSLFHIKKKN